MITVCAHAFSLTDEGGSEYCDADEDTPSGWCVYVRREGTDWREGFDIDEEQDFATHDEAEAHARGLAYRLQCDIVEY